MIDDVRVVTRANSASVFVKLPVPRPRVVTCLCTTCDNIPQLSTFLYILPIPYRILNS